MLHAPGTLTPNGPFQRRTDAPRAARHGIYQANGNFMVWIDGRQVATVTRMTDALRFIGETPQTVIRRGGGMR